MAKSLLRSRSARGGGILAVSSCQRANPNTDGRPAARPFGVGVAMFVAEMSPRAAMAVLQGSKPRPSGIVFECPVGFAGVVAASVVVVRRPVLSTTGLEPLGVGMGQLVAGR